MRVFGGDPVGDMDGCAPVEAVLLTRVPAVDDE